MRDKRCKPAKAENIEDPLDEVATDVAAALDICLKNIARGKKRKALSPLMLIIPNRPGGYWLL